MFSLFWETTKFEQRNPILHWSQHERTTWKYIGRIGQKYIGRFPLGFTTRLTELQRSSILHPRTTILFSPRMQQDIVADCHHVQDMSGPERHITFCPGASCGPHSYLFTNILSVKVQNWFEANSQQKYRGFYQLPFFRYGPCPSQGKARHGMARQGMAWQNKLSL